MKRTTILIDDKTVVDAIVGYRSWRFSIRNGDLVLHSLFSHPCLFDPVAVWPKHKPLQAECERGCPHLYCGIYAWADINYAPKYKTRYTIIGEVFLWGDVVRHERGFRAQYAKPAAFYADDLDFPLVRVNFD